ncbi:hypothetical protein ACWD25_04110 [Streptomyces sp. NPDC002920]
MADHLLTPLANPHLVCTLCGWPVPAWHDPTICRCGTGIWSQYCTHNTEWRSRCPTWTRTHGCTCARRDPPRIEHPPAPETAP